MLKKTDLKNGKTLFKREDGEIHNSAPGEMLVLEREAGELISFIPNCREIHDQDLNCDVYADQVWEVRDEFGVLRREKLTIKLGKWFGVYKRYFNIVNFEIENEDDLKF